MIGAAAGAHVLIDGSAPIAVSDWTKSSRDAWEGRLAAGATEPTQLWLDGEMLTPARWPTALWSDRSIFNWTNLSQFDASKPWAPDKYTPHSTKPMTFYDAGALARTNISINGSMFVGNVRRLRTEYGTLDGLARLLKVPRSSRGRRRSHTWTRLSEASCRTQRARTRSMW